MLESKAPIDRIRAELFGYSLDTSLSSGMEAHAETNGVLSKMDAVTLARSMNLLAEKRPDILRELVPELRSVLFEMNTDAHVSMRAEALHCSLRQAKHVRMAPYLIGSS